MRWGCNILHNSGEPWSFIAILVQVAVCRSRDVQRVVQSSTRSFGDSFAAQGV